MRPWLLALTATAGTLWATPACDAQYVAKPTVSPYLNLAQPFGNPGLNYYNLVRPQIAFRSAIQRLEMGARADQIAFQDLQAATTQMPPTGHSMGFQTHQSYFLTFDRTRPGGGPAGVVQPSGPLPPTRVGRPSVNVNIPSGYR